MRFPSGGILLPCQKYARAAKGPCPLESRPRDETLYAVVRSNENARSPLDFVSGYGIVSIPFRARPTRSFFRRALVGTLERGIETEWAAGGFPERPRQTPIFQADLHRQNRRDREGHACFLFCCVGNPSRTDLYRKVTVPFSPSILSTIARDSSRIPWARNRSPAPWNPFSMAIPMPQRVAPA